MKNWQFVIFFSSSIYPVSVSSFIINNEPRHMAENRLQAYSIE